MKNELITIIVPVYKVEKYLDRCIQSIVDQTYTNLEIILVDDGSPDNCPKMCDEWAKKDKRIKVIHKQNGGVSSARNAGLNIAKGIFIGFADPDDELDPKMYEKMIFSAEDGNRSIVICGYEVRYPNGITRIANSYENGNQNDFSVISEELYIHRLFPTVWNKLYKRNLIGDIRFNEEISIGEDVVFNMDIIKKDVRVSVIEDPLYFYYQNDGSLTREYNKWKVEQRILFSKIAKQKAMTSLGKGNFKQFSFRLYADACITCILSDCMKEMKPILLHDEEIQELNRRENYILYKKREKSFKLRFSYFLIHYNLFSLYRAIHSLLKKFKHIKDKKN